MQSPPRKSSFQPIDSPVRQRSSPTTSLEKASEKPFMARKPSLPLTPPSPSLPIFKLGRQREGSDGGGGGEKFHHSNARSARWRKYTFQPRFVVPFILIVVPLYWTLCHLAFPVVERVASASSPSLLASSVFKAFTIGSAGANTDLASERIAGYKPGRLGSKLAERYNSFLPSNETVHPSDLFSISAGREDDKQKCLGWSPEAQKRKAEQDRLIRKYDELNIQEDQREGTGSLLGRGNGQDRRKNRFLRVAEGPGEWDGCWKAKMWNQIEGWKWTKPFSQFPEMQSRNTQALDRLSRCLASHEDLLEYPSDPSFFYDTDFPSSTPNGSLPSRDFFDRSRPWIDEIPCSQTSTKVVLGLWWYFGLAFSAEKGATSGEAVWMRSQLQALYAQGYTVLAVNDYEAVTEIHRAMPDVISHIWAEERHVLTCQDDPRCIEFSTLEPTEDKYDLELSALGEPEIWNQRKPLPQDRGKRKWLWSQSNLDAIPVSERGTIPLHKLFTTTYWGARPNDNFWRTNEREFWWNPLGQEWTLSPFDYPDHTYIPFSIEKACLRSPYYPAEEREDHLFVLAKRNTYFQPWSSSIAGTFWKTLKGLTGLSALSVSVDDQKKEGESAIDLPEGVNSVGKVTMDEFETLVGKSKLMLGIGRPGISPSVYSALCQGTPVVLPYYKNVAVPTGWDLFDGSFNQHGPAAAIGAPYVYSYDKNNETMLVEMLKEASSTPIDRYIPPDMSHQSQLKNMDDLMRFDWKRHAELIQSTQNVQGDVRGGEEITEDFELRRTVSSWCHETGRCQPVVWEI